MTPFSVIFYKCEDSNCETCTFDTSVSVTLLTNGSPNCTLCQFRYSGNGCTSTCGDGLKASNESCDDGNLINGDGCSSSC